MVCMRFGTLRTENRKTGHGWRLGIGWEMCVHMRARTGVWVFTCGWGRAVGLEIHFESCANE